MRAIGSGFWGFLDWDSESSVESEPLHAVVKRTIRNQFTHFMPVHQTEMCEVMFGTALTGRLMTAEDR